MLPRILEAGHPLPPDQWASHATYDSRHLALPPPLHQRPHSPRRPRHSRPFDQDPLTHSRHVAPLQHPRGTRHPENRALALSVGVQHIRVRVLLPSRWCAPRLELPHLAWDLDRVFGSAPDGRATCDSVSPRSCRGPLAGCSPTHRPRIEQTACLEEDMSPGRRQGLVAFTISSYSDDVEEGLRVT